MHYDLHTFLGRFVNYLNENIKSFSVLNIKYGIHMSNFRKEKIYENRNQICANLFSPFLENLSQQLEK